MIQNVPLKDPLVVFCRGFSRKNGLLEPAIGSKINAVAAGLIFTRCDFVQNLLFVGGHTAGPESPSEAKASRDYMYKFEPSIPKDKVHLEQFSLDTAANITESLRLGYIRKKQEQLVSILTVRQQMDRAQTLFWNIAKVHVMAYCSQDIIMMYGSPEQKNLVSQYYWRLQYLEELFKEIALRQIVKFDPLGEWVSKYTANRGKA